MTTAQWLTGAAYFAGIALLFWAMAWVADHLTERNDNDD